MRLVINGQAEEIENVQTMGDLLRSMKLAPQRVAVERNGELVVRRTYDTTSLMPDDQLEIVTFVGGG
jgi:thiamine biosynthesis protein ThiS